MIPLETDFTLHYLVAAQAKCQPEAIAIRSVADAVSTYEQLHFQIAEVAQALRAAGIQRNDRVAVVLPNGAEMAVAFLTIASCATCAPLNPNFQAAEFDFYLNDLDAKALVLLAGAMSPARSIAQTRNIPILELIATAGGRFELQCEGCDLSSPEFAQPEDVALILHTSGTTSRPKMVPLTHRNLCASAINIATTLQLGTADRCLNLMPLFHIHGLIGVLLSSISAGGQVICSPGFQAARFCDWLAGFQPTWYSAVPTIHQAVLTEMERDPEHCARSSALRLIRSSSAALPTTVLNALEATFQVPVIEAYGMTEAAHQITSNPLPPVERKPGSVGQAIGLDVAIMNAEGQLLPTGTVGEVVIRGATVTAGYEHNPEANAKAFTNGWFRTGDQGYLDAEDYLFLQGRLKEIINRGGEKVAPLEVDAALMELEEVFQVVTFAVPHPTLGEDVAAAVVLHPGVKLSVVKMREFLFQRLVDFKIPSQIAIVETIPTGATGKLQRIGLHEKLVNQLKPVFTAPQTEIEHALAAIWTEVLGNEAIGLQDNFFALGGDSLKATQMIVRINQAFNVEFPLATVFRSPTLIEQAKQLECLRTEAQSLTQLLTDLQQLPEAERLALLALFEQSPSLLRTPSYE